MLNIEKINAWFRIAAENILRFRWINLIVFVLILVTAVGGLGRLETDIDQDNWFLEDDALLAAKARFEEIFGNDDFCAVLVEADNVFAASVLAKIRELSRELEEKVPCADDVISLTDFEFTYGTEEGMQIIDLVSDPIPSDVETLDRIKEMALSKPSMRNRIVSEDGRQTWIMLRMKPIPDKWEKDYTENPDLAIGRTVNEIAGQDKYASLNLKTTGLPVINVGKRNFFSKETPRLIGFSLLLTVLVLAVTLHSFRGVIFPLVTAVSTMVIVFGAQGFLGITNDSSMIFLPVFLSLAVSIGYSIHVFNYFKRGFLQTGNRRQAVVHAIEETGWPLLFNALTTIAALLSFVLIPLRPIRWVGLTAACLVAVTWLLVIVLLPSLLSFGKDRKPHEVYAEKGGRWLERLMVEIDHYDSKEAVRELHLIQERGKQLLPEAHVLLIGSISQFTVMMDYVTWGQVKSFFIALGVIAFLMTVVFGSLKTGLIGMIPNVAPALAVGGIMGFAGIPLDMMTVICIPMLMGLAVDDTIQFINHSQLEFMRTGSYAESTRRVFVSVGTALFLTSTVLILCFSAYLISAAKVFVNMGYLVAAGILAALLADYFITPVLLNWVRSFGRERRRLLSRQMCRSPA